MLDITYTVPIYFFVKNRLPALRRNPRRIKLGVVGVEVCEISPLYDML